MWPAVATQGDKLYADDALVNAIFQRVAQAMTDGGGAA